MDQEQQTDPPAKTWRAGETFFKEAGGEPALLPDEAGQQAEQCAGGGDTGLPASEAGAGLIPEDHAAASDVHLPASEADTAPLQDEGRGETQSWPGGGGPGTFPPPG